MTIARSIASAVAKPIAKPVASVGGGTRAALDIRASVGTSTSPTSTGTKAVTGVGFQPKVVLPFTVWHTAAAATTEITGSFGAALSSSNRAAVAVGSRNAVTTSATHRRHENAGVLSDCYNGTTATAADLTSMDADGYTLNFSAVSGGVNRIFNHICLGGADLEVSLTQQQMNGTNAAQSFAHGLSGAPTGVLFFGIQTTTAPAATLTTAAMNMGAWAGSSQFGVAASSDNGATTTGTRRALYTTASLVNFTGGSVTRTLSVSSVDATNVNVTYPVTTSTAQVYFFMLAVRGAKCQVGTFDCNGSTSPLTISTTGITPKLFLPVFVPAGVDNAGTVQNGLILTLGASDGTNNVSCGITDENGVTTTNARRFQSSTTLCEYGTTGAKVFEGTAAFSGESVVLTPSTNAGTAPGQGGYFCIGS